VGHGATVARQQSLKTLARQMHTDAVTAYIALGANLGDPVRTVQLAIANLGSMARTRLVRASSLYQTAPIDSAGPDYINAVAEVLTELPAPLLLEQLQIQEQTAGRQRPYANAPRTLDLDLLLYGTATIQSPALTVPHPRMGQRAFVLRPLAEIAPQQVTAAALQSVSAQAIRKI
jgi:2-amino-4-hydroxy-6-hydroxymethyldihydropteridine diphosphokinase